MGLKQHIKDSLDNSEMNHDYEFTIVHNSNVLIKLNNENR